MLTESSTIGRITVTLDGMIEVRRDDQVLRDGDVISTTYHRHVLAPGDDVTAEAPRVITIARAVWTPDVVAACQARRDAMAALVALVATGTEDAVPDGE